MTEPLPDGGRDQFYDLDLRDGLFGSSLRVTGIEGNLFSAQ